MFLSQKKLKHDLLEKRPLPVGMTEFDEWADRIINGAMLPATPASQKFTLSNMIMHLSPTEDFKEDAYFIKGLRKFAANQVADAMREKIRTEEKARILAEETAKQVSQSAKPSEVTPTESVTDVLEKPKV